MNPPEYEVILGKKISQNSQKATNEQKIEPKGKGSIIIIWAYSFYGHSCALQVAPCVHIHDK